MGQSASVREFRSDMADMLEGNEPILITSHGHAKAIVYPLEKAKDLPLDVKRDAFRILAQQIGKKTADIDEDQMLKDFDAWRKERRRSRR
ncbi:MAG TPA: hypothetical protein VJ385_02250 [Fibrobacteria bacterium]|jgi:hypothetical protein|nr:hypothetical protein [Fibrobacteria bacterium]